MEVIGTPWLALFPLCKLSIKCCYGTLGRRRQQVPVHLMRDIDVPVSKEMGKFSDLNSACEHRGSVGVTKRVRGEPVGNAGYLSSTHKPEVDRPVPLKQLPVPGDERTVRHVPHHLPQPRRYGHVPVLARLAVLERFPLLAVPRRLPRHPQDGAVLCEVLLAHR